MQAWVMSCEIAVRVFNGIYGWAHFPLLAVVVTGNHVILDVVAGTAVSLFGLGAAMMLGRHGERVRNRVVPLSLRRVQA